MRRAVFLHISSSGLAAETYTYIPYSQCLNISVFAEITQEIRNILWIYLIIFQVCLCTGIISIKMISSGTEHNPGKQFKYGIFNA